MIRRTVVVTLVLAAGWPAGAADEAPRAQAARTGAQVGASEVGKQARAFLLRFGDRLLPMVCVKQGRVGLGHLCLDAIGGSPRVELQPAYPVDKKIAGVKPGRLRFEFYQVDSVGLALVDWPAAPAGDSRSYAEPGPLDGFAVWPPGALAVTLSSHGQGALRRATLERCALDRSSPCSPGDRASGDRALREEPEAPPLWTGALAGSARRQVATGGRTWRPGPLRLLQTIALDLNGDGAPETLHNAIIPNVEVRMDRDGTIGAEPPNDVAFIFIEKDGRAVRLPVRSKPAQLDDIDGVILGWVDIDGDGRPELWIETPRFEGTTWQLVRLIGRELQGVAEVGFEYLSEVMKPTPTPAAPVRR